MLEGLFGLLYDGELVGEHHDLRQVSHAGVALYGHGARGGLLQSGENLEQGRFARAVLAHEGYAVFLVYNKRDVLEERTCSEFHFQCFYTNHVV